jgi:hypothetical protein
MGRGANRKDSPIMCSFYAIFAKNALEEERSRHIRREVFVTVNICIVVFWVITPCSLISVSILH